MDNQIRYKPLADATMRSGFTPIAIALAGHVLVLTPKRVGMAFDAQRLFATIECGKWIDAAHAACRGTVVASSEALERRRTLRNEAALTRTRSQQVGC